MIYPVIDIGLVISSQKRIFRRLLTKPPAPLRPAGPKSGRYAVSQAPHG